MHNDRRRKRSQANSAASATANSRPVRVNAGAPPGSLRMGGAGGGSLGPDSPPAMLPSVRTASGFGLARPPSGLLAGYGMNAFGGRGGYGGYGGGVVPVAPGAPGAGFSPLDFETARRATEPPNSLTRAAAGFLSEARYATSL